MFINGIGSIWYIDYNMSIFISNSISSRDAHVSPMAFGPLANMGVSGWYKVWYENCYILISYHYLQKYEPDLI
jgi:hypothetical protein